VANVFISSDNIITSLGCTTEENAASMLADKTGIQYTENTGIAPEPFYASLVDNTILRERFSVFANPEQYTRFEQLAICSVKDALSRTNIDPTGTKTLFILSTTKGNIDLLEADKRIKFDTNRIYLWHTAQLLQCFFRLKNTPVIISNACISGVQAILIGTRLIQANIYDHIIINGTDIISEFVLSGFNSFKSLSTGPCRPFDRTRDGLSLGEGSGTVVLTKETSESDTGNNIIVGDGFLTNDANHISGPSRTGEGLFMAISRLLKNSPVVIDYISAHGTATLYNDEMESVALTRSGLQAIPVNSFKGYWGHTLGAAGVIESIMGLVSMRKNILFNTKGYNEIGVTNPLSIINKNTGTEVKNCLKIASGFGGCNAALLFYKI
jgi:3-oxoacyl-[acyl-carrier-protein] synthase-1